MTVLELCSLIRNPKHTEVVLCVAGSEDDEVVFTDSAYNAMVSDFANCEIFNFRPMNYTIIVQLLT